MPKLYALNFDQIPPRVFLECRNFLLSNPLEPLGYRFCYENHTEIQIYGLELAPYNLPLYLTTNFSSL